MHTHTHTQTHTHTHTHTHTQSYVSIYILTQIISLENTHKTPKVDGISAVVEPLLVSSVTLEHEVGVNQGVNAVECVGTNVAQFAHETDVVCLCSWSPHPSFSSTREALWCFSDIIQQHNFTSDISIGVCALYVNALTRFLNGITYWEELHPNCEQLVNKYDERNMIILAELMVFGNCS